MPAGVPGMLALTMLLWGLNLPLVKWLTGHFDPVLLSGLRMLAATVWLAVLVRRRAAVPPPRAVPWGTLLLCALLMVYLNQLMFAGGLARTTATNGALISALQPLMASLLAVLLLREHFGRRRLLGALMALAGVALAVLQRPAAQVGVGGLGDLMVVMGVLSFTTGAVLLQRLATRMDTLRASLVIHAVGAACLLVQAGAVAGWSGELPRAAPAGWPWLILVLSGVLSTGLGNLLWARSIGAIGMAQAAMWLYWVPIVGIATAVIFLGEPLTVWHLIGLALVLAGTRLGAMRA